jgi:hypothetical protein
MYDSFIRLCSSLFTDLNVSAPQNGVRRLPGISEASVGEMWKDLTNFLHYWPTQKKLNKLVTKN